MMKKQILTALLSLSAVTLTACNNQKMVLISNVEPSDEVKKNLKIYELDRLSTSHKIADLVNTTLNKNLNIFFHTVGENNVYDQITRACILSGDLKFKEIVPNSLYGFDSSERLKGCILNQIEKPISYNILARSFLVVVPASESKNKKAIAEKANDELNKIFKKADHDGKFTIGAYLDAISIISESDEKIKADTSETLKN